MKKLRRLIAGIVVLVIALVVVVVVYIDYLAKRGIESGSTYALGVDTTLHDVDIGILSGRSELAGLHVDNPPGFSPEGFLNLGDGVIAVSLASLTKDTIEVPEFSLTGIVMNLERKGGKSNYSVILDNLKRFSSREEKPEEEKEGGKKLVIREILVRDVKVNVNMLPVGGEATKLTVPIEEIRLQNVGTDSDKGVLVSDLAATLVQAIIVAVLEKGGNVLPANLTGELNTAVAQVKSLSQSGANLAVSVEGQLKELSNTGKALVENLNETADQAKQTLEGFKGIIEKPKEEK